MLSRDLFEEDRPVIARYQFRPPRTTPLDPETGACVPNFSYGYVAQAVEIEVDTATGHVRVLRVISVENGADWVKGLLKTLAGVYAKMPDGFLEDPVAAFKRGIYITPFWEENFAEIVEIMGADRCAFGSDWPHPEGLSDPITYVDDLKGLPDDAVAKIMGGNLMELMKVKAPVAA